MLTADKQMLWIIYILDHRLPLYHPTLSALHAGTDLQVLQEMGGGGGGE